MNRATRINVTTIGVLFGFGGITHGIGEIVQGNKPTGGLFINAVAAGSSWSRWTEGGEGAFTIVPNFLVTGILAVLVGLAIIYWSLYRVHKDWGPGVFLLLFVLLFLVGGGIGQVIFFIPAWWVATRIHRPLTWWRNVLPASLRKPVARLWPVLLVLPTLGMIVALYLAVFGYVPGFDNMARLLNITLSMVGLSWLLFLLTFVAGFAYDIEHTPVPEAARGDAILVAYASRHGSTAEVAEAVAETLCARGLAVDLQNLRDVQTLAGYRAIVMGAPLYMFRWHNDAKHFLADHQQAIATLPTAVFALGPFADKPKDWEGVRAQLDSELAKFPWLKPVTVEIVGGKFDPATLRFPFNWIPGLHQLPVSDIRDWDAIRAWANNLAATLQPRLT
ncbi:MAG: flavodoxin domain-containing protein [Caldilineaceae bacterium]